ncbi:B-4DMT family transporter [Rhodococcus kronopolitis]|uniref:B-4DMT family transporter n=1 Tax=Rhodococcus kronopolitis TaxID=1460226 RepID=A0ABV9FKW9_9NOCA
MNSWLLRGLGMAFVHVVARVLLGIAVTEWPLHGSSLRWVSLAAVILVAMVWGGIDGIRDERAYPGEDEGADLTMRWLKAGVLAGLVAGLATWAVGLVSDIALGENSLFFEMTSGAAFTILLVFVPATLAVTIGRLIVRREVNKSGNVPVAVGASAAAAGYVDHGRAETDSVAYAEEGYAASEWSFVHGTDEQAADQQAAAGQGQSEQADYDEQSAPTEVFEAVQPQQSDDTEIFEAVQPQPSDETEVFPAVELPNDKQGPRK